MNENLREELGIDDWLEIVKEDKNLYSAYIPFAQYMHILEKENHQLKEQLKQRDEVIDEVIEYLNNLEQGIINGKIIGFNHFIPLFSQVKSTLNKYKGDNNE